MFTAFVKNQAQKSETPLVAFDQIPDYDTYVDGKSRADGTQSSMDAAVFEDALSGVDAATAGGFGFVVGIDRVGQADAMRAHEADIVVSDLDDLVDRR